MPGLVPGIHFRCRDGPRGDARNKSGHDRKSADTLIPIGDRASGCVSKDGPPGKASDDPAVPVGTDCPLTDNLFELSFHFSHRRCRKSRDTACPLGMWIELVKIVVSRKHFAGNNTIDLKGYYAPSASSQSYISVPERTFLSSNLHDSTPFRKLCALAPPVIPARHTLTDIR